MPLSPEEHGRLNDYTLSPDDRIRLVEEMRKKYAGDSDTLQKLDAYAYKKDSEYRNMNDKMIQAYYNGDLSEAERIHREMKERWPALGSNK